MRNHTFNDVLGDNLSRSLNFALDTLVAGMIVLRMSDEILTG